MKAARIQQIEDYIRRNDIVKIHELCENFNVSINTIRRDLKYLKQKGTIDIIYGGAKLHNSVPDIGEVSSPLKAFSERNIRNSGEKSLVCQEAAKLVKNNDILFIDSGTSTVPMVPYLSSFKHLTIITNSIYVAYACVDYPQMTTIVLPGILKNKTGSLVGEQCEKICRMYNINQAFMACTAFSLESGASIASLENHPIKKLVMQKSNYRHLLLDSSKLKKTSLLPYAQADEFNSIIIDKMPPEEYWHYFKSHGVELYVSSRQSL